MGLKNMEWVNKNSHTVKTSLEKQKFKAAAAVRKLSKIEGEGVINERTAQRWCNHFNSEDLT